MSRVKAIIFFFCLVLAAFRVSAQDADFDIYILMGQSNMAGRGEVSREYRTQGHPDVYMLNKKMEWVPARHPLHFDKPQIAGVGLGLSFGIAMAEAEPGKKIGLVPCAVGGTPIADWDRWVYDAVTGIYPYENTMWRIREAMKHGTVKGVLWHQGEGDTPPEKAAVYLDKLGELISRVREVAHNDTLPFVAGELGRYKEVFGNINEVLIHLPEKVPHTAVVSSEGLTHKGDGTHFDSGSLNEFGKRYARAMIRLLNIPEQE